MKMLLTAEQLREGVRRIAGEVNAFYEGRPLTIVGVLTGSIVFVADLIRQLDLSLRVGVIQARSYRGAATSPGPLEINADLLPDIRGRHVLLVDDIFDTGHTLFELMAQVDRLAPSSVRSAVLLRKRGRQEVRLEPDHVGFEIPNEFVVGYGLDHQDLYRHLPYVASLEDSDLQQERLG
ncbi:MAG: hypoxanthine phosphoribosyltransferase [Planctomycetes bacterium]|nr:hypoxanthine phosphoribosyltransferase [Planctomycetota bacterium]